MIPAIFVSSASSLKGSGGGVQICTREFVNVLRAAGFDLTVIDYDYDRRIMTRVERRLAPRPYVNLLPPDLLAKIVDAQHRSSSNFIFLNLVTLAPLVPSLRKVLPQSQIILLSHGLESIDYFHALRITGEKSARSERTFGRMLLEEAEQRKSLDHVFCLAPFETAIERWLGAKQVSWVPRIVSAGVKFDWSPLGRLGCVTTIDHLPNKEGLSLFLDEFQKIAPAGCRFRLIGGPVDHGRVLADRSKIVEGLAQIRGCYVVYNVGRQWETDIFLMQGFRSENLRNC